MARIRILDETRNHYIKSTTVLTPTTALVSMPVAASQNPDRTYVWRSVTATTNPVNVDVDLGSSQALTCAALANVKLIGTGQSVSLYERGTAGSPGAAVFVATFPAQDRDARTTFVFFNSLARRHWQIRFTNLAAVNDYAELGYVHLGTYLEPTVNYSVPTSISRTDPSVTSLSLDGQPSFARRTKFFSGEWEFNMLPTATFDDFRAIYDSLGVSGAFFQVADAVSPWQCWLARMAGDLGVGVPEVSGRYHVRMPWAEVR